MNAKFLPKIKLPFSSGLADTDFSYCGIGQLCTNSGFTKTVAFLFHLVVNVVFGSPQKKVIGSNTGGVITPMTDVHSRRNLSMFQYVGVAVGCKAHAFYWLKTAVSKNMFSTDPLPARIGFVDVLPKSNHRINPLVVATASVATKFPVAHPNLAWICHEISTAVLTHTRNGWNSIVFGIHAREFMAT